MCDTYDGSIYTGTHTNLHRYMSNKRKIPLFNPKGLFNCYCGPGQSCKYCRVPTAKRQRTTYIPSLGPANTTSTANPAINRFASHARSLRQGINELKTLDIQFTGAYNATFTADTQPAQVLNMDNGTATVQAINLCQQGTGISQRLGNKIAMKSLRLRLKLLNTANVNDVNDISNARVMILYDRNPNGAYQASSTILGESLQSNSIGTGTHMSNLNPNYFDRYTVLMDKLLTLPPRNHTAITGTFVTGATTPNDFILDEFVKLRNLESQFSGTANPMTIAQISSGALVILSFGGTATQAWCLTGTARLRYYDV